MRNEAEAQTVVTFAFTGQKDMATCRHDGTRFVGEDGVAVPVVAQMLKAATDAGWECRKVDIQHRGGA